MIMKQSKIFILTSITLFLASCGTVKEGFKNQKKDSSDEFLVEKKSPLIMPPDYNELPVPKEENLINQKDENEIKKLLSKNKGDKITNEIDEKTSSIENSLLKKIKDN